MVDGIRVISDVSTTTPLQFNDVRRDGLVRVMVEGRDGDGLETIRYVEVQGDFSWTYRLTR